ncbi:MAG: ANTAR domain-containing response regulator [Steroidobacteraceae bacterium]
MNTQRVKSWRILITAGDTSIATRLADLLLERGHHAAAHIDPTELMAAVSAETPDLVILCAACDTEADYVLGATLSGMLEIPFIVLAAEWDERRAADAAEHGALAFLAGSDPALPQSVAVILAALQRYADARELRARLVRMSEALERSRTISMACGVLMERRHLSRQEAFETLRAAARARRMRLIDSAAGMLTALEAINELARPPGRSAAEPDCDRVRSPAAKSR